MAEERNRVLARLAELGAAGVTLAALADAPDADLRGVLADYEAAARRGGLAGKWSSDAELLAEAETIRRR